MEIIQLIGKTLWLASFVEILFLANRKLRKGILLPLLNMVVNAVLVLFIVLYAVDILKLLGLL